MRSISTPSSQAKCCVLLDLLTSYHDSVCPCYKYRYVLLQLFAFLGHLLSAFHRILLIALIYNVSLCEVIQGIIISLICKSIIIVILK